MIDNEIRIYDRIFMDADGSHADFNYRVPLSINFFRLELYNLEWDMYKIMVFEAFIILTLKFGNPFYFQQKKFFQLFRINEHVFRRLRQELTRLGFLTTARGNKNQNFKNYYTVNFEVIIDKIDEVFNFYDPIEGEVNQFLKKHYKDEFGYLSHLTLEDTRRRRSSFQNDFFDFNRASRL